jgi:hypothetical protein
VAEEPVNAPDQLKPSNLGWARIVGVAVVISLLAMTGPFNNHSEPIADFFLLLTAGIVAVLLVGDAVLRRRGLRP